MYSTTANGGEGAAFKSRPERIARNYNTSRNREATEKKGERKKTKKEQLIHIGRERAKTFWSRTEDEEGRMHLTVYKPEAQGLDSEAHCWSPIIACISFIRRPLIISPRLFKYRRRRVTHLVHKLRYMRHRQRRAKSPPREVARKGGYVIGRHTMGSPCSTVSRMPFCPPLRSAATGLNILNVSCYLANAMVELPLSLPNFSLFCLLREHARLVARGKDPGLHPLLPG